MPSAGGPRMPATDPSTGDRRWWNERTLALLLSVLAVGAILAVVFDAFGPERPIVVGPRTTVVTSPLAADGLPDYPAASLALAGPAPAPVDNAAVDLLRATWPMGLSPAELPRVCGALGIADEPPAQRFAPLDAPGASGGSVAVLMAAMDCRWPWRARERPDLATWLAANGSPLDSLVAAADKPRYWFPCPSLLAPPPETLVDFARPDVNCLRDVSLLLESRALLHLGEGRHDAAWLDLRAIRRWARLIRDPGSGPTDPVALLTSVSCALVAEWAIAVHLLGDPDVPPDVIASVRAEYAAAETPIDLAARVRREWLRVHEMAVWTARRVPGSRTTRGVWASRQTGNPVAADIFASRLDWNAILECLHDSGEAMETAIRLPTYAARQAEVARLEAIWHATVPSPGATAWSKWPRLLSFIDARQRSTAAAHVILDTSSPASSAYVRWLATERATAELSRASAGLAAWRADQPPGTSPYPQRLDELVPRYLDGMPIDPFTDMPLRYERRGDGYLLMSVGHNGIDDGGDDEKHDIVDGRWSTDAETGFSSRGDLVIRLPVPRRLPADPAGDASEAAAGTVD